MVKDHLKEVFNSCLSFKYFEIEDVINEALREGVSPSDIRSVLCEALKEALQRFRKRVYAIPQLYAVCCTFERGLNIVKLPSKVKGRVMIGTLGSVHYVGKDIVKLALMADGFEVIDLGENLTPEQVVKAVEEVRPDIVALSTLVIICLPLQKRVIQLLEEKGLRDKVKVLIGGPVTSKEWAKEIKADGWATDAFDAVKEANKLMRELKGSSEELLKLRGKR